MTDEGTEKLTMDDFARKSEEGAIVQVRKLTGELGEANKQIEQLKRANAELVGTIRVMSKVLG